MNARQKLKLLKKENEALKEENKRLSPMYDSRLDGLTVQVVKPLTFCCDMIFDPHELVRMNSLGVTIEDRILDRYLSDPVIREHLKKNLTLQPQRAGFVFSPCGQKIRAKFKIFSSEEAV